MSKMRTQDEAKDPALLALPVVLGGGGGMREQIITILEAHLSATDEWGGAKLAGWRYGSSVVVDGIGDAADEITELLSGAVSGDATNATLTDDLLTALEGILAVVNVRIDDPRCWAFDVARMAVARARL